MSLQTSSTRNDCEQKTNNDWPYLSWSKGNDS